MGRKALVVDDSNSMRQMVSFTLQQAGFETVEGANGVEGLQRLAEGSVDLVITDLNMPEMDGISFIKQLRTQAQFKFTPVLMLTTETQDEKKSAGRSAGATGWITKPFNPERLLQVIKKVLP